MTRVEFTLDPHPEGTRLRLVESALPACHLDSAAAATRATRAVGSVSLSWHSIWPCADARSPDAVFAALADPTRRRVLRLVAERGPTSATLLERELPVTRQAIVKHLVVLSRAGLVTNARGKKSATRWCRSRWMKSQNGLPRLVWRWDERLARLRQVVLDQETEDPERISARRHRRI